MLIIFDVLPLDSRTNIECRRINARFCESSGLHTYTLLFRRGAGTQQTFSSSPFTATDRCICRADIVEMGRDPAVISKSFCVGALRGTYHYPDVFVRPVSRQPSVLILRASLAKTLCSHTCPLMIISGFACRIGRRSNQ